MTLISSDLRLNWPILSQLFQLGILGHMTFSKVVKGNMYSIQHFLFKSFFVELAAILHLIWSLQGVCIEGSVIFARMKGHVKPKYLKSYILSNILLMQFSYLFIDLAIFLVECLAGLSRIFNLSYLTNLTLQFEGYCTVWHSSLDTDQATCAYFWD